MLEGKPYAMYAYEDRPPARNWGGCTDHIAQARNRMMEVLEERVLQQRQNNNSDQQKQNGYYASFYNYDYLLVMDMDGICGGPDPAISFDVNVFHYALAQANYAWDAMSF